jgi:hypothetical protein
MSEIRRELEASVVFATPFPARSRSLQCGPTILAALIILYSDASCKVVAGGRLVVGKAANKAAHLFHTEFRDVIML